VYRDSHLVIKGWCKRMMMPRDPLLRVDLPVLVLVALLGLVQSPLGLVQSLLGLAQSLQGLVPSLLGLAPVCQLRQWL